MPLLSLVASSPEAVRLLTIEQVVATAGDGRLRDGTESQRELREYLRQVAIDALATYADYCLTNSFPKGGHVLQDIVNELGRRLEYDVTNGRYQGTTNAIGFDGIWRDPAGYGLVVEVKTTDAYRLSLDTVAFAAGVGEAMLDLDCCRHRILCPWRGVMAHNQSALTGRLLPTEPPRAPGSTYEPIPDIYAPPRPPSCPRQGQPRVCKSCNVA